MDPLSVTASILGLLGAAQKVSSLLVTLINHVKEAPRQAEKVLLEVNDISACLSQLQNFLSGSMTTPESQAKLLMVDQIIVTLTTCVMTFSELEEIATNLQANRPLRLSTKVRWAMKEQKISRLLLRLQSSKASLNLMLTILTWWATSRYHVTFFAIETNGTTIAPHLTRLKLLSFNLPLLFDRFWGATKKCRND